MKQFLLSQTSLRTHVNQYCTWLIFGLTFLFIVWKAVTIPITHDEVASALYYSKFSFWEIVSLSNGDQNNHILNSLLTKWSVNIFGLKLWAVRLPSILSFLVYAYAVIGLLNYLLPKHSKFYIAGALLFVLSPYLIDFFSLSRGYGMAVALTTLSMYHLVKGISNKRALNCYLSIVFATLTCFASFSSISFLCATIAIVFVYLMVFEDRKWVHIGCFTALVFIIGASMFVPLSVISNAQQFSYWSNNGFIQDTLMSLVRLSLYGSKIFLTTAVITCFFVIVLVIGCAYFLIQFLRSRTTFLKPALIVFVVLFLTILINVLQSWMLNLPNLNGRIALFFYPLIVAGLIASKPIFNWMHSKVKWGIVVIVIGLGIHHIFDNSNKNNVLEWSYDAYTFEVLNLVKSNEKQGNVRLDMNWLFHPSLTFHHKVDHFSQIRLGPYSKEIQTNSTADYYYCKAEDYLQLEANYTILAKFEDNWLLKHK